MRRLSLRLAARALQSCSFSAAPSFSATPCLFSVARVGAASSSHLLSRQAFPHAAARPRGRCSAAGAETCWSVRACPGRSSRALCPARDSPPRPAQCGAARREDDLYFCTYCQSILPPSTAHDYFSLLGETRRFDLVPQALELAFKEAQKLLHPDKFTTRGEEERRHSAAQAARVNAAYATLRAPLSRARYLVRLPPPAAARAHPPAQLQLQGAPASEEGTMGDAELLAEVMEAREEAEAARDSPAALRELRARVAAQAEETEGALRRAFGAADVEGARRGVDRLSYLEKLGEDLQEEAHAAEARGHAAAEQAFHG